MLEEASGPLALVTSHKDGKFGVLTNLHQGWKEAVPEKMTVVTKSPHKTGMELLLPWFYNARIRSRRLHKEYCEAASYPVASSVTGEEVFLEP